MDKIKAIDLLLSKMKDQVVTEDTEVAHIMADNILTSALQVVSQDMKCGDLITELIDEYDSVNKWYS